MNITTIVNTFRSLTLARETLASLEAQIKALKATATAHEAALVDAVQATGPVVIDGKLVSTATEESKKKAKVGEAELIKAVKAWDLAAGELIETVYKDALKEKDAKNEAEKTVETVLVVADAPRGAGPILTVTINGQAVLAA